jgi:hypothetical protein
MEILSKFYEFSNLPRFEMFPPWGRLSDRIGLAKDHRHQRILLPYIARVRSNLGFTDEPAVLLMDNCSVHMRESTLRDFAALRVKMAAFPNHNANIFQCLDLSLFGILKKRIDYRLPLDRNDSMAMFIKCIFHNMKQTLFEDNVLHLSRLESGIISTSFPIASFSMNLHFARVRGSSHFGVATILWGSYRSDVGMCDLVRSTKGCVATGSSNNI